MARQLAFDFTMQPSSEQSIIKSSDNWIDVSDIAAGAGFPGPAHISSALEDALKHRQDETEADYDQRLFDLLWLAYFRLTLDQVSSTTFNFMFEWRTRDREKTLDTQLGIRVEIQAEAARLGLAQDL